jgi:hypothetical protein
VQRLGQGREELWDALYFSEEEMLDFTPAFSDVCSDALLSAHEAEIQRLEALKEQRLPILQKIDRHRELVKERDDLQQSSQDASRLMGRGQKGERRDPGKLLREEKMRKRISKELPKIEAELRKTLERWEDEYGISLLFPPPRPSRMQHETTGSRDLMYLLLLFLFLIPFFFPPFLLVLSGRVGRFCVGWCSLYYLVSVCFFRSWSVLCIPITFFFFIFV